MYIKNILPNDTWQSLSDLAEIEKDKVVRIHNNGGNSVFICVQENEPESDTKGIKLDANKNFMFINETNCYLKGIADLVIEVL